MSSDLSQSDQLEHESLLQQSDQNMNRAVDPSCHVKGLKRNTYKTATLTSAYMTRVSVACPAVGGFMWSSTIMKGTVKYLRNHITCQPLLNHDYELFLPKARGLWRHDAGKAVAIP